MCVSIASTETSGTVRKVRLSRKTYDSSVKDVLSRMHQSYSSMYFYCGLLILKSTLAHKGTTPHCRSLRIDYTKWLPVALGAMFVSVLWSDGSGCVVTVRGYMANCW